MRSKLGDEGYDRVIVFAGAFSGARRIETDMIFRYRVETGEWGFGLLPLWGGRPDEPTFRPKRGWLFSLAWFFDCLDTVKACLRVFAPMLATLTVRPERMRRAASEGFGTATDMAESSVPSAMAA